MNWGGQRGSALWSLLEHDHLLFGIFCIEASRPDCYLVWEIQKLMVTLRLKNRQGSGYETKLSVKE